eukprot:TRINITY_DN9362_c0_g1_i1.p1 TRINITY_DN9362_c0_g1~~TRINITY_DN9362_c0_g1_i1.p1  ORF type:complete len:276 (+),score=60.30 TRINITY_DN9362_c0_g1_i1:59-829(+)
MPSAYISALDRSESARQRASRQRSLRGLGDRWAREARDVSPRGHAADDWGARGDYRAPDFYTRSSSAPRRDYGSTGRYDAHFGPCPGSPYSRPGSPYARAHFAPPPPRVAHDILAPAHGYPATASATATATATGMMGMGPPVSRRDVEDLADLYLRRKFMRALEEYYAPGVVMSDNGLAERVGKEECRRFKHRFLESVLQWHDVAVRTIIASGSRSVLELLFDVTFRSGRRVIQKQALVQEWSHGAIVRETAYHMI